MQMLEDTLEFEATEHRAPTLVRNLVQYPIFNQAIKESSLPEKSWILYWKKYASMQEVIAQISDFEEAQIKRE